MAFLPCSAAFVLDRCITPDEPRPPLEHSSGMLLGGRAPSTISSCLGVPVMPASPTAEQPIAGRPYFRWLLRIKAELPHGHFGPWLDKQEGLSRHMASQCMRLVTGGRQHAREASAA